MKNVLLVFCIIFGYSCSETDKIPLEQKIVTKYIINNLDDPKSYIEPVEWGELDSLFSKFEEEELYIALLDSARQYSKISSDKFEKSMNLYHISRKLSQKYDEENKWYMDRSNFMLDSLTRLSEVYIPKHIGFTLYHSFRVVDNEGNPTLIKGNFILSVDTQKVIKCKMNFKWD